MVKAEDPRALALKDAWELKVKYGQRSFYLQMIDEHLRFEYVGPREINIDYNVLWQRFK